MSTSQNCDMSVRGQILEILHEADERLKLLRSLPDTPLGEGETFVWLLSFRCHRLFGAITQLLADGLALASILGGPDVGWVAGWRIPKLLCLLVRVCWAGWFGRGTPGISSAW